MNATATAHGKKSETFSTSREMPKDLEAEKCLIGSVMLHPASLDEISVRISPQDFYLEQNQNIWAAILWLYSNNKPIEAITVFDRLKATDRSESDSLDWLIECVESMPHGSHAGYLSGIVDEKSARRAVIYSGTEAVNDAYEPSIDVEETVSKASTSLGMILERRIEGKTQSLSETLIDAMNRLTEGKGRGLATGFETLDDLHLFQGGSMIVLGARPSVGKTSFGVNIGLMLAQRGVSVGMLSLEQSRLEIAERLLSAEARLSLHVMRGSGLTEAQVDSLMEAAARLGQLPFVLDDCCLNTSIVAIESSAKLMRRRYKIECLIVDYLQLVKGGSYRTSREQEVAEVSRRLKGLAKAIGIPMLCLAQLNRESEKGNRREPRVSDLRESGSIEADADAILLMHRPDVYESEDDPKAMYLNVAKHRNGPTAEIRFMFDKSLMTFRDMGIRQHNSGGESGHSRYSDATSM